MNFGLEEVELFLNRYHLQYWIQVLVKTKSILFNEEDNEVKEIGTLDVIYEEQPTKIRIQAEIHIEDVRKRLFYICLYY
ncbi:hypothetical protein LAV79_19310 [Peribacillus butanolivorans]|uniref:hypothetical protein n=1 Tax=Peribacillus butanolivorans TaxID=421767 RepID=UPI0030C9AB66